MPQKQPPAMTAFSLAAVLTGSLMGAGICWFRSAACAALVRRSETAIA